eukprot:1184759-Prorocentrum_minimum.AAC.5
MTGKAAVPLLLVLLLALSPYFRTFSRAQELDAEEDLVDPDLIPGNETSEEGTGDDGELEHPPRPKARSAAARRSARSWLLKLTSVPQNCSGNFESKRPGIQRLPVKLPPNRVSLKDLFITRENYIRLGLSGLQYPHSLPPDAMAIASRYKWRTCAVVGNSGTLLDSHYGASIDKHDVVIRWRYTPRLGILRWVGIRNDHASR